MNGIATAKMTITVLSMDDSFNNLTIMSDEIIKINIIIQEEKNVIFKAEPIILWTFLTSKSGFNWLTNLIIPVSRPILARTSDISIIAFANEYIPRYSGPTHLANNAVYKYRFILPYNIPENVMVDSFAIFVATFII